MKNLFVVTFLVHLVLSTISCQAQDMQSDTQLKERASQLAQELIIVDSHIDVPYRLAEKMEDISVRTQRGDFDYPRAKAGGLNAPFMSIYVPSSYEEKGGAKAYADKLISMVEKFEKDWPDKFAIARSVQDIQTHFTTSKISLPMGMENGSPFEGKIDNVRYFYGRGIRYVTLTHSKNNHLCDSSFDDRRKWNGLSPFGEQVVAEMNRLGMMIDVSHVSDSAFYQVMRLSKAPVIASHSSCRHFTPGWERNMDDEMIKLLASNGGVIQINFGSMFLVDSIRTNGSRRSKALEKALAERKLKPSDPAAREFAQKFRRENPVGYADVADVVAHIDHVVKLVGVDFVGIGSDYDGVGDSLPTGLKDVSTYPNLIFELLKKGYTEKDVEKICSGNFFRVWSAVDSVGLALQTSSKVDGRK